MADRLDSGSTSDVKALMDLVDAHVEYRLGEHAEERAQQRFMDNIVHRAPARQSANDSHSPTSPTRPHQTSLRDFPGASWLFAAACMLILGFGIWALADVLTPSPQHAPLRYVIRGQVEHTGTRSLRTLEGKAEVSFEEQTSIELAPGTDLNIAELDHRGACVDLEQGSIELDVTSRPQARWKVQAGEIFVEVTGTLFRVTHLEDRQRTVVQLYEGGVRIRGAPLNTPVELRAGQQFTLEGDGEWTIRNLEDLSDQRAGKNNATSESRSNLTEKMSHRSLPKGSQAKDRREAVLPDATALALLARERGLDKLRLDWAMLVEQGRYAEVIAAARERGLEDVYAKASLDDLVALSDAARYQGLGETARRALYAQIERAPNTRHGRDATFLLGRLAEDRQDSKQALSWYTRYINQTPKGRFLEQAYGRRLLLVDRAGDTERARELAQNYIELYPKGSYVPIARQVLDGASPP